MSKKIITMLLVLACVICAIAILSSCGTKYTVTFDPNGGTLDGPTTIQVKEGGKIPVPTVTKDGSILTGWYAGAKANTKWDFENDVHIFGTNAIGIVPEAAWLFACYYFA